MQYKTGLSIKSGPEFIFFVKLFVCKAHGANCTLTNGYPTGTNLFLENLACSKLKKLCILFFRGGNGFIVKLFAREPALQHGFVVANNKLI